MPRQSGRGGGDERAEPASSPARASEADDLIRFVAGPDGSGGAGPEARELPGRGCWVTPERWAVDKAAAKGLFSRALKQKVDAPADLGLGELVDMLLARQLAGMINMAMKAGEFVAGSAKVDLAIRSGAALATISCQQRLLADGVRKLDQARTAFMHLAGDADAPIPALQVPLQKSEIGTLLHENAFKTRCSACGKGR